MLGVYIHIPYCRRLCPYCDFLREPISGTVPQVFVDALCREIGEFEGSESVGSVFFGGGTPSLLDPADLQRILAALQGRFRLIDPEITLEANPDDVDDVLAEAWSGIGINRVSLGVQSFDDRVLRYLGRRHDASAALNACLTVAARFENWAMDLIFGAPPVNAWTSTLQQCAALRPAHVSTYGLTYEPGTPFEARRHEAVDEDLWLELYRGAPLALEDYEHYEISNYARQGYQCRHNLIYWHNEEYVGFGPGAYSFLNGMRLRNVTDTAAYIAAPGKKEERLTLTPREVKLETVIQHLRLRAGIEKRYYQQRFSTELCDDFGEIIERLAARGLISETKTAVQPTAAGFELNNEIGLALVGGVDT